MINFKGRDSEALSAAIAAAGHWVRLHDNVLTTSDEEAVQAIIDAFTLGQKRAPIIVAIKELAREKILAFLPDWKQSNLNARLNELNEARFSSALTDTEHAEVEAMRAVWESAKAIRNASNAHESALAALNDFDAVSAYDITTDWP